MLYPVYVHVGDADHAHGVTFPDFPGCFSAADDWSDLPAAVQEAVEAHFSG
jgi:predicted RNase H-like HicB family nuclease